MCGVLTAPHSRGPPVCWFVRRHFFLSFNFSMSVCKSFFFWLLFCSHGSPLLCPRCCPGRRVVCSHTLSSIRITQAVQMNWTSSSMEESSSSLSYWTLWVKYIHSYYLYTLGNQFNCMLWIEISQRSGAVTIHAVTHAVMTAAFWCKEFLLN